MTTYAGILGDSRCECSDTQCKAHAGTPTCNGVAISILYRVDMEDATGTAFCEQCADDAFDSGLFTDSTDDDNNPEEPDIDDSVHCCPDCERPNQFGELCPSCTRERSL